MIVTQYNKACSDYLTYNAAAVGAYSSAKSNQIILFGNGSKRLDGIQASWIPIANNVDPATLRNGRIIIAEGIIGKDSNGAYLDAFIDPNSPESVILAAYPGLNILVDLPTVGASHRIITLGDLGIMLEQDKTLTILQTPMYISGNTEAQPGATLAHLSCQVSEVFAGKETDYKLVLR